MPAELQTSFIYHLHLVLEYWPFCVDENGFYGEFFAHLVLTD
jgi:hypothetical protein